MHHFSYISQPADLEWNAAQNSQLPVMFRVAQKNREWLATLWFNLATINFELKIGLDQKLILNQTMPQESRLNLIITFEKIHSPIIFISWFFLRIVVLL